MSSRVFLATCFGMTCLLGTLSAQEPWRKVPVPQQVEHLRLAAKNLEAAGMVDQARELQQRAEMLQREHEQHGGFETNEQIQLWQLSALREEVARLHAELRETRELVASLHREIRSQRAPASTYPSRGPVILTPHPGTYPSPQPYGDPNNSGNIGTPFAPRPENPPKFFQESRPRPVPHTGSVPSAPPSLDSFNPISRPNEKTPGEPVRPRNATQRDVPAQVEQDKASVPDQPAGGPANELLRGTDETSDAAPLESDNPAE